MPQEKAHGVPIAIVEMSNNEGNWVCSGNILQLFCTGKFLWKRIVNPGLMLTVCAPTAMHEWWYWLWNCMLGRDNHAKRQ